MIGNSRLTFPNLKRRKTECRFSRRRPVFRRAGRSGFTSSGHQGALGPASTAENADDHVKSPNLHHSAVSSGSTPRSAACLGAEQPTNCVPKIRIDRILANAGAGSNAQTVEKSTFVQGNGIFGKPTRRNLLAHADSGLTRGPVQSHFFHRKQIKVPLGEAGQSPRQRSRRPNFRRRL
jgi:hypothetical protein